jgi:AcrR family transcriptional regulator
LLQSGIVGKDPRKLARIVLTDVDPANAKGGDRVVARKLRRRDSKKSSASILQAALREFQDRGYDGARIASIAERSKINKRMIYHYFGSKEDLYMAALERSYFDIRTAEAALDLSHRDPIGGVRELVRFTWNYFLNHPEFLSILATENMLHARFLKKSTRVRSLRWPLVAEISGLLQRGTENGQFRPGQDPVRVYISIASLVCFFLSNRWTLSTIFNRDFGTLDELSQWGSHIEDAVLTWLSAPAERSARANRASSPTVQSRRNGAGTRSRVAP